MRLARLVAVPAVLTVAAFSQTAIEYGVAAGKSAAVASGMGVAAKGTVETGLQKTQEALAEANKTKTSQVAVERDSAETTPSASRARGKTRATRASRSRPASKPPARGKNSRADDVAAAEMRLARARPQNPASEPSVVDPEAIRSGMTRDELDALGKPFMSISGAEGETRVYRTASGSVSVRLREGRVDRIQP
jgi:hypothetical protein